MMEEGDLKNRIKKLVTEFDATTYNPRKDLFDLVDEMKEELPFDELPYFDRFVNIEFTVEETRELVKWFKKWWFGDKK